MIFGIGLFLAAALSQAAEAPAPSEPPRFLGVRVAAMVWEHLDGIPFESPHGLHYDREHDELYVADSGNALIGIYDGNGVPKFTFSTRGRAGFPIAVDVDANGNIYVLDAGASSIAVYDYRANPLPDLVLGEVQGVTVVAGGMTLGPDGRLYVLDSAGGRILVVNLDGSLSRVVRGSGPGGSRLQAPHDLAFDAEGNFYVTDRRGTPVQIYDASGRYLRGFGQRDIGADDFSVPSGISVDEYGNLLVVDPLRQDIKVLTPDGLLLDRFGGFGGRPGEVAYPTDVAAGRGGRIYVIERVGRRMQIFERIPLDTGPNGAPGRKTQQATPRQDG